jgi:hypothetical protein
MAENKILKNITSVYTDKSINGWLRGAIWVGTIAVVYIGGKSIYTKIFPSEAERKAKQQEQDVNNEVIKFQTSMQPSYEKSVYDDFANKVYTDCKEGSDLQSSSLEDILKKMNNNLDVALLMQSYGTRTHYGWFGSLGGIMNSYQWGLLTAAQNCFDSDKFGVTFWRKGSVNSDWAKKGITYQIP